MMKGGRSRKMRGGNGYGVGKPISVGALEYVPNMTSVPDGAAYKPTGGRRGKSRKGKGRSRRTRKTRRTLRMKGGGSVSNVGYGFAGEGSRGLANYGGYASNLPPGGAFAIPTGTR